MAFSKVYTSADYNAYIDADEADLRIDGFEPFVDTSAWTGIAAPQKQNLIVAASADANRFDYYGELNNSVISNFNMKFPRTNISYANGVEIPPTEVPEFIKSYVAQRIMELLSYTYDQANSNVINSNVKRVKVDVISREFFDKFKSTDISINDFESYRTIQQYVIGSTKSKSYFLERG